MEATWACRSLVISSGLRECFWSDRPSYPKGQPESSQHKGSPCRMTYSTSSLPIPTLFWADCCWLQGGPAVLVLVSGLWYPESQLQKVMGWSQSGPCGSIVDLKSCLSREDRSQMPQESSKDLSRQGTCGLRSPKTALMWQSFFFTPSKQRTDSSHSKWGPAGGQQSEWGQGASLAPFSGFCLKTVLVQDDQVRQLKLLNQWEQHKHLWSLGQTGQRSSPWGQLMALMRSAGLGQGQVARNGIG